MKIRAGAFALFFAAVMVVALGARQDPGHPVGTAQGFKPTVFTLLSDTRAFLVEVQNTGTSDLLVTTEGRCRMRIDAMEIPNDQHGGSSSGQTVKPGESWRELVRLVDDLPSGRRVPNPLPRLIVGNEAVAVSIPSGKHTVAFRCGGEWSDDVSFYWITTP
jgi:hypothetical protein